MFDGVLLLLLLLWWWFNTCKLCLHKTTDLFTHRLPSGKVGKAAVDVAYRVLMDRDVHSPEVRKAAGERMCLPFLRECGLETLREFFLDHIQDIMAIIEANFERVRY